MGRDVRTLTFWNGLKNDDRGASAAIGNFDGVHLGHRTVVELARARADTLGAPLGIVTFEPHPREFFAPDAPPFRLMNAEARANRLEKLGVERLYQLPFDGLLAGLSPERFARDVIADGLGLAHVFVGADFRFGKGRAGTAVDLKTFGKSMGFGVTIAEIIANDLGEVSSTNIRKSLSDGRPADAAAMLGHWHRIDGEVFGGDQRGRQLGYPTANMSINRLHPPKFGIYAVKVDVLTGPNTGTYDGAASVGIRPMFGENQPNLETFLIDFDGDLYGEHLSIALIEYLRPEAKFDSLEALVAQMDDDCARAREILATIGAFPFAPPPLG
jgi:riboflavin kinase/FMN adenylyltransferase